jgi:hypothetical protein
MTTLYKELAAAAYDLIAELGRDVTINRYTYVTDLVEGTSVPTLSMTQGLKMAVLPASGGTLEAFDIRFAQDVLDDENVRFAIVAAQGHTFVPKPGDEAIFEGVSWLIMGNTPLDVDGITPVIFSVGFRMK